MKTIGIRGKRDVVDRLFWLFDLKNDGQIDLREWVLVSSLFKQDTLEERVGMFFELCDVEGEGWIDETKLANLFKRISSVKSEELRGRVDGSVSEFVELMKIGNEAVELGSPMPQVRGKLNAEERAAAEEAVRNVSYSNSLLNLWVGPGGQILLER